MELQIMKFILTKNDCYRVNRHITPKGVMVHSTGANNPRVNRYVPIGKPYSQNHWNKTGIQKCVHAFVGLLPDGTVGICQTLPWTVRGWHAGSHPVKKLSANNTHISFEVCEDNLEDPVYFREVYNTAVKLVAYLCKIYDLNPKADGVVISHHEGYLRGVASNHADIDHWLKRFGLTMHDFRRAVANELEGGDKMDGYSQWAVNEKVEERIKALNISDGSRPQETATREEVFAMLLRMYDAIKKGE